MFCWIKAEVWLQNMVRFVRVLYTALQPVLCGTVTLNVREI